MGFLKKKPTAPGGASAPSVVVPCALAKQFPAIWEFLTLVAWEDRKARVPGTILFCLDEGRLKAWVNDRDGSCSAWVSSGSLLELLEAIDEGLRDDDLEWRAVRGDGSKKSRK